MFSRLPSLSIFTSVALLAAGLARGQDPATIAKPLAPPASSSKVITQAYIDDAPPYNSGSSASKSIGSASTGHAAAPKTSISTTNVPAVPTVSSGEPVTSPRSGSQPSVATANAPVSASSEDAVPRDTRPLSQRLKALRQPVVTEGKSDSWDESTADAATKGSSSRRAKAPAEDESPSHPLSLSEPAAGPHLAPVSPEAEAAESSAPALTPPPSSAATKPSPKRSSRRTVVNPEELAVPEPTPAASENVLFKRQSPLLSVETAGPRTVTIGKEAVYTVTLNNGGDVAAQDLVVGVRIPDWTDVVGSQPSAGTTRPSLADGSEPFQWRIPRLEAHGKETLSLRLVPRKGRPFDLNVQWTFSPIASQTMVDVQEPKLVMNIAGPDEVLYGQSKLYRLTLSNPGTGKAENVAIDLWPVGNATAAPTRDPLGSLKAGESKVIELELTARQGGTVTIHASASADPSLKTEASQEVLVRRAAVAVAIDGAKSRYAGTVAAYTIKVSNPGNAPAENVRVAAALPPEAKFTSASQGGQWKAEQGKVIWTLPTLKPGEDVTLELRCTLSVAGANKLQVMSSAAGDLNDMADIVTNVEALADLKLDVSEPAGPIAVGDEMVYELHVRNRGTKSAEAVAVVAYFSEGIEPISAEGGTHDISNGVVAFRPLATLAIGGEVVYKIHARAEKNGKQIFRTEVECGTLGTKLVSAEEAMIYPNDGGLDLPRSDKAIARRNSDPAATLPTAAPGQPQPLPAGTRR